MGTSQTIKLINPAGTVTRYVTPSEVRFDVELQEPSTLELLFESDWTDLYDEDDETNVGQLNSYVEYTRAGTIIFRGYILDRTLIEAENGEQMIKLICGDKLAKLRSTLASYSGEPIFTKSTPYDTITNIAMFQATAMGDNLYCFYPAPDTGGAGGAGVPWLPTSVDWARSTTLHVGMLAGYTYDITGVTVGLGGVFVIFGDHTAELVEDMLFKVDAGANEGTWTVVSTVLLGGSTYITVASNESVAADTSGNVVINSIMADTDHHGLTPAGLLMIGTEWVQYDGYDLMDNAGRYVFKNTTRAALGTTAANHAVSATIYQEQSQKIHPAKPIIMEGQLTDGGTWETIPAGQYHVQVEEGRFDFTFDVLAYVEEGESDPKYADLRCSYAVFDEDAGAAVTLLSVFLEVLTATVANGGPGLTIGQVDLGGGSVDTTLGNIRLTRVRVDTPENTLDFMYNLVDEIGLSRSSETDAIVFWYDHENDKVICKQYTQHKDTDTPAYIFNHPTLIDRLLPIEDIYSAVLIVYEVGLNRNLADYSRMWHPEVGDTIGSNSMPITHILYSPIEVNPSGRPADGTAGHRKYTKYTVDGKATSIWGIKAWENPAIIPNPGDTCDLLYCWFDDDANTYTIDDIEIMVDAQKESMAAQPFDFKLLGIVDYTIADPPVIGGSDPIAISGGLTFKLDAGLTEGYSRINLKAENIGIELQAVLCRWDGMPQVGAEFHGVIRELNVRGYVKKTQMVQLTDNHKLGSTYLYAPDSYAKLIDANLGQPRVKIIEVGPASENIATSLGRLALLQALVLEQTRTYQIQAGNNQVIEGIPKLCDLIEMDDPSNTTIAPIGKWRGSVVGINYTSIGGEEVLELRLLDFESRLI